MGMVAKVAEGGRHLRRRSTKPARPTSSARRLNQYVIRALACASAPRAGTCEAPRHRSARQPPLCRAPLHSTVQYMSRS